MSKGESGFIVNAWRQMIGSLYSMSIHHVVLFFVRGGEGDARFSEMYVLMHVCLSIVCLPLLTHLRIPSYVETIVLFYAAYRIFETVLANINIFLSPNPNLTSIRRSIILLFHNYIELLFWFACIYLLRHGWFEYVAGSASATPLNKSVISSLYFSVVTMTTLGYGDIWPIKDLGRIIVSIQTLIGLFMGITILARFIAMLPQVSTKDPEEQNEITKYQKGFARLVAEECEKKREKHKQGQDKPKC